MIEFQRWIRLCCPLQTHTNLIDFTVLGIVALTLLSFSLQRSNSGKDRGDTVQQSVPALGWVESSRFLPPSVPGQEEPRPGAVSHGRADHRLPVDCVPELRPSRHPLEASHTQVGIPQFPHFLDSPNVGVFSRFTPTNQPTTQSLTLSLPSSKGTYSQPFKDKCMMS